MRTEAGSRDNIPSVVIIDDDKNILELTSQLLSTNGFQTYGAERADEALERISSLSPELVLLDYMVPGTDGLPAVQQIMSRFPDTYVVLLADREHEEAAARLMECGASEYFLKPFTNRYLLDRLKNVLRVRETERHNRQLQQQQEQLLAEMERWDKQVREKAAALHAAQEEITQSEKIAAMGYLSAGVSHEIRNPLNSISLFIQLMRQTTTDPDQLEYQSKILKEVDRIDSVIRTLLDSSRRASVILSDVQITQVIDSVIEAFSHHIEIRKIQIGRQYYCVPPPITADPTELAQIFTNLFLNALEAMSNGGRLDIEVLKNDDRVIVRVSDSGTGISANNIPRIFEPFFSTRSRGTGMGLPVAQRIARMYKGNLEVENTTPGGTTFRLDFPACT